MKKGFDKLNKEFTAFVQCNDQQYEIVQSANFNAKKFDLTKLDIIYTIQYHNINGHLEMVKYLNTIRKCNFGSKSSFDECYVEKMIQKNRIDIIKYLISTHQLNVQQLKTIVQKNKDVDINQYLKIK